MEDTLKLILAGINQVNENVNDLKKEVKELNIRVGNLENRMDSLENRMDSLENRIDGVETKLDKLSAKVDDNNKVVNSKLDDLRDDMNRVELAVSQNTTRILENTIDIRAMKKKEMAFNLAANIEGNR